MKTRIFTFIATIGLLLLSATTADAQNTKVSFNKGGKTVFESAVSEIDSIVLKTEAQVYAVDISAETDWSYMLVGQDGSSVFVSLDENTNIPTHLFFRPDKNSDEGYALFFRDNGLPETIVIEDYIIYMSNFNENKFDMAVIYPNDSISYFYGVDSNVDWSSYTDKSKMNSYVLKNSIRSISSGAASHIGIVGDGIGIVSCAVDIVKDVPKGGTDAVIALGGCGATLAGIKSNDFESKVYWTNAGTVMTILGCTYSAGIGCVLGLGSSAISYVALYVEKKQQRERELYYIEWLNEIEEIRQSYQINLTSDIIDIPYPYVSGRIGVITKSEWKIEKENMGWCVAKKSNGYDGIDIEITQPYPESRLLDGYREVTFRVCPINQTVPCASFIVKQIGFEYTIEPKELSFTAAGGKSEFNISIPEVYSASVESVEVKYNDKDKDNWCSASLFGGGQSYFGVKVNVTPNTGKERNAEIWVNFKLREYSGRTPFPVTVSQEAAKESKDSLILSKNEIPFPKEGDTDSFTIETNLTNITVSSDSSWCKVSNADDPKTANITVEENKTTSPRSATITVKAINLSTNKELSDTVLIKQEAGEETSVEPVEDVDWVLINGVKWATRNVDAPGTFVQNPEDFGKYYQWNTGTPDFLPYPEYHISIYNNSDSWQSTNDPSPAGYHVPTLAEIQSLENTTYVTNKWTNQNGVEGRIFTDKASGKSIFLPFAWGKNYGYGSFTPGSGYYWCSASQSRDVAYYLSVSSGGVSAGVGGDKSWGFSVRPVAE